MSTAVSIGKGGTTGVFLRKATGLVREVSLIDALIMNTLGMNVAVGAVFLFLQAPANFPNGNMLLAVVIGTLLMAFTLLWVYSEFAAAMPRSGGDYVFVSRALHPFLGWLLSWSQGLWLIFFWIGFNAWFALTFAAPTALSTISVATGQDVWMNASNALVSSFSFLGITTQWWVLLFGTLINVAFGALLLFGNRSYWRWQRWFFLFAGGSIVIAAVLLLLRGGDIPSAWNTFAAKAGGLTFDKVIPTAQSNGYTVPSGFDFGQTLLMLPWVFFVVGYAQGSAQIGGEVKRAARTQRVAMVGGVLINGAVLALLVILFTNALDIKWIGSLGYLANNFPAKLGLPLTPGVNFIVSLLTQNVVILLIIGIGFVFWALLGTPLSELQATRYMLAWALDRTVPKRLGDVSERFHTPVNGIAGQPAGGAAGADRRLHPGVDRRRRLPLPAQVDVGIGGQPSPVRRPDGDARRDRRRSRAGRVPLRVPVQLGRECDLRRDPPALAGVHDRRADHRDHLVCGRLLHQQVARDRPGARVQRTAARVTGFLPPPRVGRAGPIFPSPACGGG
jgi:amino acid transporter